MSVNGAAPRLVALVRAETDPVVRLSTAFGEFPVPANALDAGEEVYESLGAIEALPILQQLLNGAADRVSLNVSGVPAEIAALAEADAPNIQGAAVNIGIVELDEDWVVSGGPFWFWDATADKLTAAKTMDESGNEAHRVSVSAGTANAARSRPDFEMWTDAQHRQRHPGDAFLSLAPTGEKQKRWPI
jgi:hypothetical protein